MWLNISQGPYYTQTRNFPSLYICYRKNDCKRLNTYKFTSSVCNKYSHEIRKRLKIN